MPTLLHIDSSSNGDASVSRALTAEFVTQWKAAHPDGTVVSRDLLATPLKPLTELWISARGLPQEKRTADQSEEIALSDKLVEELISADEYVVGVPMYNFGVPGALKLWIDQIARPGLTFTYADGSPKGLLTGKKAHFLVATGGEYGPGSPAVSYNFVEPYLRTFFGFLGVTDVSFQTAGGAASLAYGANREEFLAPHRTAIQYKFAK